MNDKCSHTETIWEDFSYEDMEGELVVEGEYWEKSTTKDLDLFRYQCTQCGKIFYY